MNPEYLNIDLTTDTAFSILQILESAGSEHAEDFRSAIEAAMSNSNEVPYAEDMDGDFDSGMFSAGFGTDEDYGHFSDE